MSGRESYFESEDSNVTRIEPAHIPHSSAKQQKAADTPNDADSLEFDLLYAQLRVAKAARVLNSYGFGHGLGDQRPASLASVPRSQDEGSTSSTPELARDIQTPLEDDLTVPTPGALSPVAQATLRRMLSASVPGSKPDRRNFELHLPTSAPDSRASTSSRSISQERSVEVSTTREVTVSSTEISTVETTTRFHSARSSIDLAERPSLPVEDSVRPPLVRSRSFGLLPRPAFSQLGRRPSLPSLVRDGSNKYSLFTTQSPARDLVAPSVLPPATHDQITPESSPDSIEESPAASTETPPEKGDVPAAAAGEDENTKRSLWVRAREQVIATYAPRVPPALVLPSGPTDEEKVSYLKTNRLLLYSFGVFSFLSLSAGMWLFVVSAIPFYWFGLVVVLLQAYLFVSYAVSLVGKDYDYEKHKKILEENPIDNVTAPTVDIYLPCCKEPLEVIENTYKHIQALEYPAAKLKVWVLDDGASDEVKALAERYSFNYICREDRPRLKKAGNLRWAFARTEGDFFAIYDADFCPRPDFLRELIPEHMANPKAAIIQTPQFFRVLDQQTWVEQGAGAVQELFYRVIQVNRNRWGASICVGSNALYRREALKEVGGTAEIGFSEDVHTGFYALTRGWEVKYIPLCLACGICPDTPRAFFSQQMRWCMGSTTLLSNPDFWRSKLTVMQKICYLSGMMYYSAIALSIFLNPLPGVLMIWIRPDYVRFFNLAFAVPSLIYSFIAIRAWSKARYGLAVQHVMAIQNYAYFTAIKDKIFGRALAWVPSGDTKAHKNNKYRNMRIVAWVWMLMVVGALASGVTYQCMRGLPWYDVLPVILLTAFNFYLAHRFLLCHGKL